MRRNIILTLAEAGFLRPWWSDKIMDETSGAIAKVTKGGTDAVRQRIAMERAFPEACVTGYAGLRVALELPDPDDGHVLTAAISIFAQVERWQFNFYFGRFFCESSAKVRGACQC